MKFVLLDGEKIGNAVNDQTLRNFAA